MKIKTCHNHVDVCCEFWYGYFVFTYNLVGISWFYFKTMTDVFTIVLWRLQFSPTLFAELNHLYFKSMTDIYFEIMWRWRLYCYSSTYTIFVILIDPKFEMINIAITLYRFFNLIFVKYWILFELLHSRDYNAFSQSVVGV